MLQNKKIPARQSLFGLTAAGKVFSCALAFAGCLSLNIYAVFACCAACFIASVFLKDRIFCPDAFLAVPLVCFAESVGREVLGITVLIGAVLYFAFENQKRTARARLRDARSLGRTCILRYRAFDDLLFRNRRARSDGI